MTCSDLSRDGLLRRLDVQRQRRTVRGHRDPHVAAIRQLAEQQLLGQRPLDVVLDDAGHRPGAHLWIVALDRDPVPRGVVQRDRNATLLQLRQMYLAAWRKYRAQQPLTPLESQLAAVIAEHPEYTAWLETGEQALKSDFTPEGGQQNPFLHLGLHLAIREQVSTNRPAGIAAAHAKLTAKFGDAHAAEHAMLEPLAETLWEAQRFGRMPDEQVYLEKILRLAGQN